MAIAREGSSGRACPAPQDPALRIVFFSEGAAEFFDTAVDMLLGWDLITERESTLVTIFDLDDVDVRADLLEAAWRMGGDEIPEAMQ